MNPRLQWVSPHPPLRTGIANYTADIFAAVDGTWHVDAVVETGSSLSSYRTVKQLDPGNLDPHVPTVLHLGNSQFHDRAFDLAHAVPSIIVLHDVFLHHALAGRALRTGRERQYWRDLQAEYGDAGVAAGRAILAGQSIENIDRFPLVEPFVRSARAVVVHNEHAAAQVRSLVPDTPVFIVPMGIPTPATIERDVARAALGLSESAFVIGSITHVNPNKRLPVVLRALRRLIATRPDAMLVLAGTGSDGELLTREIEILGLRSHVRQLGYVDDRTARVLASALDACVNLRYPTAGETSASLLRLLGAGLPVIVSDAGASAELPPGVGLKIPVDGHEIGVLARLLEALADDAGLREDAGHAAREFVLKRHSMVNMVDGYREVLSGAYGSRFPGLAATPAEPPLAIVLPAPQAAASTSVYAVAGRAVAELGLGQTSAALESLGDAIVGLGLDRSRATERRRPSERLLARVACPQCGAGLDASWSCRRCGKPVVARRSVPDLRPDGSRD